MSEDINIKHRTSKTCILYDLNGPHLQWFDLRVFHFMMVQKPYTLSRNSNSNFKF